MQARDHIDKLRCQDTGTTTPDAESPVPSGVTPGGPADREEIRRLSTVGMSPQNVGSMSRAEDDGIVFATSPEFHDRPGQGMPPASVVGQASAAARGKAARERRSG
jgi:hypothetical protein